MLPVNETGLPRRTGLVPPFKAFMRNAQALNNKPSGGRNARFPQPNPAAAQSTSRKAKQRWKTVWNSNV